MRVSYGADRHRAADPGFPNLVSWPARRLRFRRDGPGFLGLEAACPVAGSRRRGTVPPPAGGADSP